MIIIAEISGTQTIKLLTSPEPGDLHILVKDKSGADIDLLIREPADFVEQLVGLMNFMVEKPGPGEENVAD